MATVGVQCPTTIAAVKSDSVRSLVQSFFLWFAGAIPEIALLPEVAVDLTKLLAIGQAAFAAACLAAISMSQALPYLVDDRRIVPLGAVGYGVFLASVDRLYMLGLTGLVGTRKKLKACIGRLLIAAIASSVVTLCLELKIWQPEIEAQMALEDASSRRLAEESTESADIPKLEKQKMTLLNEIRESEQQADSANRTAIAEREGLEGTGKVGFGPIWADKLNRYNTLQKQSDAISARNLDEIKKIDDELSELSAERERVIRNVVSAQDQSHGILARIRALHAIAGRPENGLIVPFAIGLIGALLFACELSPMLAKLQVSTPAYDHALERFYQAAQHHDALHNASLEFESEAYNSLLHEAKRSPEWHNAREELIRDVTSTLHQKLKFLVNSFQDRR